jgi:cytochrome b561/polyisoprenoid-binding protein YceI
MSQQTEYSAVAKLLHWLIAGFVIALITCGLVMTHISGLQWLQLKIQLYQLHKSMGVTVLGLMIVRVLWRLLVKPPVLPSNMPAWEKAAARGTHLILYILLVMLPLTGWVLVSVASINIPTHLYGQIPWPHIPTFAELSAETKKTIEPLVKNAHATMGWALLILVIIHVAAALRHSLILKDGVMSRMLPRFLRSSHGFAIVLASFFAIVPQSGHAQEWAVDKNNSSITFEANAGDQAITGTFKEYQLEIHFNPDEPKEADITAAIDLASVSTGQAQADQVLTGSDWFDTGNAPVAELRAKSAKLNDDDTYELKADLKIKGVSKRITVPFSLDIKEGVAKARAQFVINRLDFNVGPTGEVSGMVIDNNVKIIVNLTATRLDN